MQRRSVQGANDAIMQKTDVRNMIYTSLHLGVPWCLSIVYLSIDSSSYQSIYATRYSLLFELAGAVLTRRFVVSH